MAAWVHVGATTHRGVAGDWLPPAPGPPWAGIDDLVASYLGRLFGERLASFEADLRRLLWLRPVVASPSGDATSRS